MPAVPLCSAEKVGLTIIKNGESEMPLPAIVTRAGPNERLAAGGRFQGVVGGRRVVWIGRHRIAAL